MSDSLISWSVNGQQVDLDLLDINGIEWRDAKAATGLTQAQLTYAALIAKELDAVGAMLWIALRRIDPALTYEAVLSSITLRSLQPVTDGG